MSNSVDGSHLQQNHKRLISPNFISGQPLKEKHIARLVLEGNRVVGEERLMTGLGERVRDVAVAADGAVWAVTDEANGKLVRLAATN